MDRNDEAGVTTVFVDKVRFKHLGKRGYCLFHYDVINGRFNPCEMGKGMDKNGEVIDRYMNVQWQADPWILPDGTLLMPSSHQPESQSPTPSATPPTPAQQTIPFS